MRTFNIRTTKKSARISYLYPYFTLFFIAFFILFFIAFLVILLKISSGHLFFNSYKNLLLVNTRQGNGIPRRCDRIEDVFFSILKITRISKKETRTTKKKEISFPGHKMSKMCHFTIFLELIPCDFRVASLRKATDHSVSRHNLGTSALRYRSILVSKLGSIWDRGRPSRDVNFVPSACFI